MEKKKLLPLFLMIIGLLLNLFAYYSLSSAWLMEKNSIKIGFVNEPVSRLRLYNGGLTKLLLSNLFYIIGFNFKHKSNKLTIETKE